MKITIFSLVAMGLLLVGCATQEQGYSPINVKAKKYAQALESADKSCQVDADCTSVDKGCCLCQGREVVNQAAAQALRPLWQKECSKAICTLQMCFTQIETWCERGECKSKPAARPNYSIK